MGKLNGCELELLYFNFVKYRDIFCKGKAEMSVKDYYNKYGLYGDANE